MKNNVYPILTIVLLFLFIGYSPFAQSKSQLIQDIENGNMQGVKDAIELGISVHTTGGRFNAYLNMLFHSKK